MSEEEKEAIKWLNNFKDTIEQSLVLFDEKLIVKCGIETMNKFTAALNLIDKQHKEIYRLQEENKTLKEQIHYKETEAANKDILKLWRKK